MCNMKKLLDFAIQYLLWLKDQSDGPKFCGATNQSITYLVVTL